MKKSKPNQKPTPSPNPKPKYLPFEIDEKTLSKQIQTIFKLMKRTFLDVRAGSRELENEKTKTNTKPTPKPKHLPFEIDEKPFQNKSKPYLIDEKIIPGSESGE